MKRRAISQLFEWKNRPNRKPLIIRGARQVGKTWLMKEFASKSFEKFVYVNFEEDEILSDVFKSNFDINRIFSAISLRKNTAIDKETLLIFDEIQAAPRGITALKYFYENAPEQPIITAGSLLGISMHHGDSFPVGKVDFLDLRPMSFVEFLEAMGEKATVEALEQKDWLSLQYVKDRLTAYLRTYYYVGGMPEVVKSYIDHHDLTEVRRLQNAILSSYDNDFSKHAPAQLVPRMRMVWASVIGQLSKENRKFIYGMLREGARAKDFELAIEWLEDAGLIHKVCRTKSGQFPLNAFEDYSSFKLFLLDVGLLSAMGKIPADVLLKGNELLLTYKGALTEQYVFQQLHAQVDLLYYWSAENSSGEIDFLIQKGNSIIPIEVKAEENLKARSLRTFVAKHQGMHGLRFSMSDYRQQEWMTNIPLYAVGV